MEEPLLYHGTNRSFYEEYVDEDGKYRSEVYLSINLVRSLGYAYQRARQFNASPLLIIVKSSLVKERLEKQMIEGEYRLYGLEKKEHIPLEIPQPLIPIGILEMRQ